MPVPKRRRGKPSRRGPEIPAAVEQAIIREIGEDRYFYLIGHKSMNRRKLAERLELPPILVNDYLMRITDTKEITEPLDVRLAEAALEHGFDPGGVPPWAHYINHDIPTWEGKPEWLI